MSPSSQLAALTVTLAAALPAGAATTIFTSPASFAAQLAPGSYTETFVGLNTPVNNATSLAFAGGGFAYTVSQASGLYGVGTFIGTGIPNVPLTITFTSGNVTALGGEFFNTDAFDSFQSTPVTITLNDGTTTTFTPADFSSSFRGFVSTSLITSLVLSAPGGVQYAGLDNLTVGAVPEPSSWALMILGLGALTAAARRHGGQGRTH